MADSEPEIRADSRWMTYEEAGERLGIGPDSVARYARREKWPRQKEVFAPDVVNLGLFPGPWDEEIARQRAAVPAQ